MRVDELLCLTVLLVIAFVIAVVLIVQLALDTRRIRRANQPPGRENRIRLDYLSGAIDYRTLTEELERLTTELARLHSGPRRAAGRRVDTGENLAGLTGQQDG